jgi:hypothetical protein
MTVVVMGINMIPCGGSDNPSMMVMMAVVVRLAARVSSYGCDDSPATVGMVVVVVGVAARVSGRSCDNPPTTIVMAVVVGVAIPNAIFVGGMVHANVGQNT